jgi:hypothetical protein
VALEKHHPLIDSIYRESPLPITMVQTGSSLNREQLSVYGKFSTIYRILGQVLAGYFLLADRNGNRSRVALTIQAVETQGPRRRYHLNILGTLPGGQPIGPFVEEVADSRLADAMATARGKLAELSLYGSGPPPGGEGASRPPARRRRHGYRAREEKVFRILNRLAQSIDKIYRQRSRRTLHARSRHRDRERPASTALRDALHAGAESIFRDVQEGTWVVVGPRTRVHVFNDGGQHITSVVYPGETIRKRTTLGKWRAASPEDIEAFRARLRQSASSEN